MYSFFLVWLSLTQNDYFEIHPVVVYFNRSFHVLLSSVSVYGYTTISVFIHLFSRYLGYFSFYCCLSIHY